VPKINENMEGRKAKFNLFFLGGFMAITVAVLDTGIYRHIDFGDRIVGFVDYVNGKNFVYDDSGHGTHVNGLKHNKK